MLLKDTIMLAKNGLKHHKLRTLLTIFGIIISIGAVYSFFLLGDGVKNVVEQKVLGLGSDVIRVVPKNGQTGNLIMFKLEDIKKLKKIKGIKDAFPVLFYNTQIEYKGFKAIKTLFGVYNDKFNNFQRRRKVDVIEGKLWKKTETNKIMLGYSVAKSFFPKEIKAKDKIIINGVPYIVSGILEKSDAMFNNIIAVNYDKIAELYGKKEANMIMLYYDTKYNADKIKEKIENSLKKRYDLDLINVMTPKELIKTINQVLGSITAFVLLISLISLIISAINIANTMYSSVLQRTNEIGIMKAVGAKNSDIKNIFMIESGLMGFIGGLIGVILAAFFSIGIQHIVTHVLKTEVFLIKIHPIVAIGLITFSTIIGMLSGLNPAIKASKINPVDALHYE